MLFIFFHSVFHYSCQPYLSSYSLYRKTFQQAYMSYLHELTKITSLFQLLKCSYWNFGVGRCSLQRIKVRPLGEQCCNLDSSLKMTQRLVGCPVAGTYCLWVRSCFRRSPDIAKLFLQKQHSNGRSPVWVRSCFRRSPDIAMLFLQKRHSNGRSPVWMRSCATRCPDCVKLFLQKRHSNRWSPLQESLVFSHDFWISIPSFPFDRGWIRVEVGGRGLNEWSSSFMNGHL